MEKIIYIHGLNCTGKIFNYIHSNLPEHNAQFIEYDSHQSIIDSLNSIHNNIDETPTWIIGHSLGGILGYLLIQKFTDINIKGLVTISSPFGGSSHPYILNLFFPSMPVLKDISTINKFYNITKSNKKIEIPFMSIISTAGNLPFIPGENDGVVTIESQRESPAEKKIEIFSNHFEIMQHPDIINYIKSFIFENKDIYVKSVY